MNRQIVLTHEDFARMTEYIETLGVDARDHFGELMRKLHTARLVPLHQLPPGTVGLGATVRLREDDLDEPLTVTVTLPGDVNAEELPISVLSNLGTALLGASVGETISWEAPAGVITAEVDEVIAPEVRTDELLGVK